MPMFDRRRTRQLLLFLGNVVSGVVTPVVTFAVVAWSDDMDPLAVALTFVVAPTLGICGWRFVLERRGRERDQAKRVAWEAFWVLIAWEAVPIVFVGTVIFLALTDIVTARDRPGDWSSTIITILVFPPLPSWPSGSLGRDRGEWSTSCGHYPVCRSVVPNHRTRS